MTDDIFDNMKRLKAFEEILIAFSNNKIIFKELKDSAHLTMKIREDGILDFHNTKEGTSKEYESLVKFDLKKFQDPQVFDNILSELLHMVKAVNFTESEFENYFIVIFPTKEDFFQIASRKNRDVTIGLDDAKELFGKESIIPWNEGNEKLKEIGSVYDENSKHIGFVSKISVGITIFFSLQSMEDFSKRFMTSLEMDKKLL